jgi:hypothetical protein
VAADPENFVTVDSGVSPSPNRLLLQTDYPLVQAGTGKG